MLGLRLNYKIVTELSYLVYESYSCHPLREKIWQSLREFNWTTGLLQVARQPNNLLAITKKYIKKNIYDRRKEK